MYKPKEMEQMPGALNVALLGLSDSDWLKAIHMILPSTAWSKYCNTQQLFAKNETTNLQLKLFIAKQ